MAAALADKTGCSRREHHYTFSSQTSEMKTFSIGNDRSLKLNKNRSEITIADKETKKAALFTPARWASFQLCIWMKKWKCEDFKCVWKPTESRLCLTHKLTYRRHRQSTIRSRTGQGRGVLRSLRWRMARVGDEVVSMCRPPQVLRAEGGNDMETDQNRHCSTPLRMADAQGCHRLSTPRQSGHHRSSVAVA